MANDTDMALHSYEHALFNLYTELIWYIRKLPERSHSFLFYESYPVTLKNNQDHNIAETLIAHVDICINYLTSGQLHNISLFVFLSFV